jgi:hypothetical protein
MALSPKKKQIYLENLKRTNPQQYYAELAQQQADEARAANEKRYTESMGIYDQIISQYAPGGEYMKGAEAGLERQKTRDVATQVSQSISSGLFGTTVPATAGKRWEEDVGQPQRLKLEDVRTQAYAGALGQKAEAIERREDAYPDYSSISNMMTQAAQAPQQSQKGIWMSRLGGQPYFVPYK